MKTVGETQRVLLEKIEELALYVIEQNRKLEAIREDKDREVAELKAEIEALPAMQTRTAGFGR